MKTELSIVSFICHYEMNYKNRLITLVNPEISQVTFLIFVQGDSGGPVIYNGTIQGIVSYGESHCAYGTPDVHTNVALYLDWIDETLKKLNNQDSKKLTTDEPTTKEL